MRQVLLTSLALLGSFAALPASALTLEREFTFERSRVTVERIGDRTLVSARGSSAETDPGRPDLPWFGELVELPAGQRVVSVEVIGVDTEPLAEAARLSPAVTPRPGLGPILRSAPDARFFEGAGFQPAEVVRLGEQGSLRGRAIAGLQIAAARWQPESGRLERIARVRVRFELAPETGDIVRRERIVPEWEDVPLTPQQLRGAKITTFQGPGREAEPFRPQQIPSLLGSPVAYLIITNDAMTPTFQQLADWKTQSGVPAVVRSMSFVRQQYPSGADDAEKLRLFIRDAYSRWGTKWVLLGGDTDVIPERLARTLFYGGENIATDLYYSALDGNWNADGDSLFGEGYQNSLVPGDAADLYPEVYVGRATVSTVAEAQVFVNKTLQYIRAPVGDYEQKILMFSEVLFPQDWNPSMQTSLDGAELTEDLLPIFDQDPGFQLKRLYENHLDPRWRPGSLLETRAGVISELNAGNNVSIHIGHGYRNVMSVGDASLTNADATGLTNGNRLINLYAINCTSNAIDFPCIGEAFMKNPNGGTVTNVGSTRFDFPTSGRVYQEEYFRLFVEGNVTAVGELQARQKLPFIAFSTYDGVNRWTQMTLLMLGDPELRMWRPGIQSLSVSHPAAVAVSDSQVAVTVTSAAVPLPGARVVIYRPGDEYVVATTDGAGQAVLPFRPDDLGTFMLTVTAANAVPYQVSVPITATAGIALADGARTIDDDNVGGTVGDGDGLVDAGETIDLRIPVINRGAATATGVTATLSTTDPLITVSAPFIVHGSITGGTTSNPPAAFRISFPYDLPDQREVPFTLHLASGGQRWTETFQITVRAPELWHYGHTYSETGGTPNGVPDVGESVSYGIRLRNNGTGIARGVSVRLRSYDGLATVTDSMSTLGDIATGVEATGDVVTFTASSLSAKLALVVSDVYGVLFTRTLDLSVPSPPTGIVGLGKASSISMVWARSTAADLLGYHLYRSTTSGGPFVRVTPVPTGRTAYYSDQNLAPLTRYYYRITAVDSSGNESAQSVTANASTNPPTHPAFPVPTGRNTPASTALEFVYSGSQMTLFTGADKVYVINADGTAPVDADGTTVTTGDFSLRGEYFAAGPSVATLAPGQGWSVVAASWDSTALYVFDTQGQVRSGWPLYTNSAIWSGACIGDIDGDGDMEIAFGSNGSNFYVMHHDGTEVRDGDANPATKGVFKVLASSFNYGTPAMADIDNDGVAEIVYGGFDGRLYAWNADGTNVPGFPLQTTGNITASVAIGYLDGPGDTSPEIVFPATNDSLYVLQANGMRRPGWPVWTRTTGATRTPSPALADINNDGFLDIVWQSTNGGLYVWNRTGTLIPPFGNLRYSPFTSGASESSPVVADINGDGFHDIITGDESGLLTAFSGLNGQVLAGFPIQLEAEIRGTAAVGDIDRDGLSELVVTGWDKNVYVWDYDFPFSPNGPAPWPQFHHDARRTGFYNAPLFVGVEPAPGGAGPVARVELSAIAPNPARQAARLWFGVPAELTGSAYEMAIHDLSGRLIKRVQSGTAAAGRFSLEWDLRGEDGRIVEGGVYFARLSVGGVSASRKLVVLQ